MRKNKSFSDIEVLLSDVQQSINNVLENEVMDVVRKVEMQHIKEDVLDVYSPTTYQRRSQRGIDDERNIVSELKNNKLTVYNIAEFNDGYLTKNHGKGLAYMINEGGNTEHDYEYGFRTIEAPYSMPRPFIDNTIEELDNTDIIEKTLEKGLKKHGIDLY